MIDLLSKTIGHLIAILAENGVINESKAQGILDAICEAVDALDERYKEPDPPPKKV